MFDFLILSNTKQLFFFYRYNMIKRWNIGWLMTLMYRIQLKYSKSNSA